MSATSDLISALSRAILNVITVSRRTSGAVRGPSQSDAGAPAAGSTAYPGDFTGRTELSYAPNEDGVADPGEVVWTWVPYQEDTSKGKDRPAVVIGRDGRWLLVLPMTSKDHDRDAEQEASEGRYWHEIGSGPWDSSGRVSEVRVNRIVRVDPSAVRRIAGKLDRVRYQALADAVRARW